MDEKNNSIGLSGILTIIFVIAKLLGVVNWSWWLVFAPVFIQLGIFILFLGVLGIAALIDHKNGNL